MVKKIKFCGVYVASGARHIELPRADQLSSKKMPIQTFAHARYVVKYQKQKKTCFMLKNCVCFFSFWSHECNERQKKNNKKSTSITPAKGWLCKSISVHF